VLTGQHRRWEMRFDHFEAVSRRRGFAQLLPGARDPIWDSLGVPAPMVFELKEGSDQVVGLDDAGNSVTLSEAGGAELYLRNNRGLLPKNPRAWSPARGVEVTAAGEQFQAGSSADLQTDGSLVWLFVVRTMSDSVNSSYMFHKIKNDGAGANGIGIHKNSADQAQCAVYRLGVSKGVALPWGPMGEWALVAGTFDARTAKGGISINGSAISLAAAHAGTDLSNTQNARICLDSGTDNPQGMVYAAYWDGSDAEELIDNWSSFVAEFWKHGSVEGVSLDCDCVVATPAPGGEGYAIWGSDQARLGADGLEVRKAVTQQIWPSVPDNAVQWLYSNVTPTLNAGDGLGGLRTATYMAEDAINAVHTMRRVASIAVGANTYRVVIDPDGRYRGRLAVSLPVSGTLKFDWDLSTEIVSNETGCTGTIFDRKDGTFEILMDYTAAAGDAGNQTYWIYMANNAGVFTYLGDGSSGFYVLHAQSVQAYDRGPLIPSVTGTVSTIATDYRVDREDIVEELAGGAIQVKLEFIVRERVDDIALLDIIEGGGVGLDFVLVDAGAGTYMLEVNGMPTTWSSRDDPYEDRKYRLTAVAYTDGDVHVILVDLDNNSLVFDEVVSGTGFAGLDVDHVKLGQDNTGSRQGALVLPSIGEAA